jgi:hypothetical protein
MTKSTIFFPVDQREQAAQSNVNSLLALDIFKDLTFFLKDSIQRVASLNGCDINEERSHNAILLDGERGTGKSSVLVNLPLYLKEKENGLFNDLLILKPVDPTLLESSDDLFLNVIVAAIINDKTVKNAINTNEEGAEAFHRELQELGNSLESLQLQNEHYGLDRLRAFLGNHGLVQRVHALFDKTLKLVNKKILVLPIDDVDTSLHQAFENLEVVRKYLTSPYVLPIITGDLSLYHEVTWRDFHCRLLKDSKAESVNAIIRAKDLAYEYERKILPLQYRRTMPTIDSYMSNKNIVLTAEGSPNYLMFTFLSWLEALINERTNGFENSHLKLPIRTVRELSQLISIFREEIPCISKYFDELNLSNPSSSMVRRVLIMPISTAQALRRFRKSNNESQSESNKSKRESKKKVAYTDFFDAIDVTDDKPNQAILDLALKSKSLLTSYVKYDPEGGSIYMTMMADNHFMKLKTRKESASEWQSVFETSLFQPLTHSSSSHKLFSKNRDINNWTDSFRGRVPDTWINNLPTKTILPYPIPEVGYATTHRYEEFDQNSELLVDMVIHRNFYSINKKSDLICCGRIFELIITSLIKDIKNEDVEYILQKAPFYSFSEIASTKALTIGDEDSYINETDDILNRKQVDVSDSIVELVDNINQWRHKHFLNNTSVSSWLIYNVMNKFFSQVNLFNQPLPLNKQPKNDGPRYIINIARKAFRSIWAAFGSFEKGNVFGLPRVIASVNVGDGDDFEMNELYLQNILPFLRSNDEGHTDQNNFGSKVMSFTSALADHPLKKLIDDAYLSSPVKTDLSIVKKQLPPKLDKDKMKILSRKVTGIIKEQFILESIDEVKNIPNVSESNMREIRSELHKAGISEEIANNNHHYKVILSLYEKED